MSVPGCNQHLKTRFLNALRNKLIVSLACKEAQITRHSVEKWKTEDPEFRNSVEQVELEIIDRVKELALKRLGIIPFSDAEDGTGRQKWIDNSLIALFLRREQVNVNITNSPTPLHINGLTPEMVANLSKAQIRENEIPSVSMNGAKETREEKEMLH